MKKQILKNNKFKVCLYLENPWFYRGSGIAKALDHQKKALELNNIDHTLDTNSDYHILHINSQLPGALSEIRRAKKKGRKVIIHAHMTSEDFRGSLFFSNLLSPLLHYWLNFLYSHADLIICPSTYTRDLLKKNYSRLKDKKIVSISNGIDISRWKYDKKRGEKFRKDYKFNGTTVFAVGLVFPRKGIVDFIRTARKMPDAVFYWAGRYLGGLVKNRKLSLELKNKPANFQLLGFVDDIIGAYSAGDIFFFPSHEENEGIVVLEAAAMGKAIVVRDIPVFRSYLKDGENCLMASDVDGFVAQIKKLMDDSKLRAKLSKNARKLAESKSLKKIGSELKKVYTDLLNKR